MRLLQNLTVAVFLFSVLGIPAKVWAQAPDKMSYQAVVRDSKGKLIANKPVGIRIEILQGSATGSSVYTETHMLTSNTNGLVSMEVGGGTVVSGSFSGIDWSAGPYFIKTEADPDGGTNYTIIGVSQLLSVPYALYAKRSETPGPKGDQGIPGPAGSQWHTGSGPASLSLGEINDMYLNTFNGEYYKKTDASTWTYQGTLTAPPGPAGEDGTTWITGDGLPNAADGKVGDLFLDTASGKYYRKTDNTTWDLVNVLKGVKGDKGDPGSLWYTGSGKPGTSLGKEDDLYMDTTTADFYKKIDANTWEKQGNLQEKAGLKGTKNYVVKFTSPNTGGNSQIFDSVNVGINTNKPVGKLHIKGGEDISQLVIDAVSGQKNTNPIIKLRNGDGKDLVWINSDDTTNLFIGLEAGKANNHSSPLSVNGSQNTFVGSRSGYSNETGIGNTAGGFRALYSNSDGNENTAFGSYALTASDGGSFNTAVGYRALSNQNSMINTQNTAIGAFSMYTGRGGFSNTAVGMYSLYSVINGVGNAAFGERALYYNTSGTQNTAVGMGALQQTTASYNTAGGHYTLSGNTIGAYNTAFGQYALQASVAGSGGTALGYEALYFANNTSTAFTNYNVAIGFRALRGVSFNPGNPSPNTGNENTVIGYQGLTGNTTGSANTGTGRQVLYTNTKGSYNVAYGAGALYSNTTASRNIAIGYNALYTQSYSNSSTEWNSENVAIGYEALYANQPTTTTSGNGNTAIGNLSLRNNTTGDANTGIGYSTLYTNTTGVHNVAVGDNALYANTTGKENTATGMWALLGNTSGSYNTANGVNSLHDNTSGSYNTVLGMNALYTNTTGATNTAIGYFADANSTGYSNSSAIGNTATITASNQVRVGNSSVTSIGGYVDWTNISDERYKTNIKEDVPGIEFIRLLHPVTYQLDVNSLARKLNENRAVDTIGRKVIAEPNAFTETSRDEKESITQTGFLAQDVEKAANSIGFEFSAVDAPKNANDLYGLRYSEFVVPLVKAVQEQQAIIESQNKKLQEFQKEIDELRVLLKKSKTE